MRSRSSLGLSLLVRWQMGAGPVTSSKRGFMRDEPANGGAVSIPGICIRPIFEDQREASYKFGQSANLEGQSRAMQ